MHFEPPQLSTVLDHNKRPFEPEPSRDERRDRTRSAVRWPVLLFRDASADVIETITENLNCAGFFCFSNLPVVCGELLTCILRVPTSEAQAALTRLDLLCSVRVVRVERSALASQLGIACRIETYRCLASGPDL